MSFWIYEIYEISEIFSEYLFLLTILIKPQSGFKIAFAMLDQDGNERIDREEFRVNILFIYLKLFIFYNSNIFNFSIC